MPPHTSQIGSAIASDSYYDQIAFFPGTTQKRFTGAMNVFDFDGALFGDLWQARPRKPFSPTRASTCRITGPSGSSSTRFKAAKGRCGACDAVPWSEDLTMGLRFIGQPFADGGQIGRAITDALGAPGAARLWIATAWGKQSGLGRIRSAVAEFRAAGGTSEVIVGIDEGGATREGLVRLVWRPSTKSSSTTTRGRGRLIRKLYAVDADASCTLIVGSGNLTKGGLYTNYEAAFVLDARQGEPEWAVRNHARTYFDALLSGGDAIRPLNEELIGLLAEEGWVTSEARQNRRRAAQSRSRGERQRLFGTAVPGLGDAPPSEAVALPAEEEDEDSALPPATTAVIDSEEAGIQADEMEEGELEETTEEPTEVTGFGSA